MIPGVRGCSRLETLPLLPGFANELALCFCSVATTSHFLQITNNKTMDSARQARSSSSHNHVYVRSEEHAWVPARLLDLQGDEAIVQVPQIRNEQAIGLRKGGASSSQERCTISLADYPNKALPLQNCGEDGALQQVEDMIDLPHLHEAAILYNLKARHALQRPYTRTGDIVIAVNPYEWIHELYTEKRREQYSRALVWSKNSTQQMPAPHVYEVSALAFRGLALHQKNQSILVSGESGAGKTETVKICLNHIASVQRGMLDENDTAKATTTSPVVQRVLDSNPLLEAFGNAKTTRNDNSSRFGKYIQLQFDGQPASIDETVPSCVLAGSQCEVYLLEKSRVVHHNSEERTYHIFYQLLAAPAEIKANIWDGLVGTNNESFNYVGFTDTNTIEGQTDGERFAHTMQSLELIGVQGETFKTLFRSICVVLQLGNIVFQPNPEESEGAIVANMAEFDVLANLIGIPTTDLLNAVLQRKIEARGEVMTATVSPEKAKDACDAFAKDIYGRAFLWLVQQINDATCAEKNYEGSKKSGFGTIGLLDIFGFESFETNGFEQLCINYANEKLQQKFTQDIFTTVMAEYLFEGIKLEEITYDDNTDVLDLIEGRTGLLAMLNEECFRPNGNDCTFVNKALATNKTSPCLIAKNIFDEFEFGIHHYAGPVVYNANSFVTKNTDTIPSDLMEIALLSSNKIIAASLEGVSTVTTAPRSTRTHHPWKKQSNSRRDYRRMTSSIVGATIWTKFKTQLNELMGTLEETQSRYIRCIKPNSEKAPRVMEHTTTVEQLRCAGVVAAITISRSAFPNRLEHQDALDRFRSLWPKGTEMCSEGSLEERSRADVETLLTSALKELETKQGNKIVKAFVIGRTRAYFRAGALEHLDAQRLDGMGFWATEIQRVVRGVLQQRRYRLQRKGAIQIQSGMRRFIQQRRYQVIRQCAITIQSRQRTIVAQSLLVQLKEQRDAAIPIQRIARGMVQRLRYRKALQDKKDEANMLLQMEKMQREVAEAEKRVREELEREREVERQKFEEEKRAMLEAEQKRMEEERNRMLAEERKKMEQEKMRRTLEEAERRGRAELEREREVARKKLEEEERVMLEAARKRMEEERNRMLEEERKTMEQELRELREEKHLLALKYQESEQKAAAAEAAAAIPPPEPEVRIVEVVKYVEKEAKPSGPIMTAEQKALMEESGKIIEFLRNENVKLKKRTEQQKRDFETLKENNQRLMEANASAGQSFQSLNQHAKHLNSTNQRLTKTVAQFRHKIGELHSEIKNRQTYYSEIANSYKAETETRIFYEQAMLEIIDMVSAKQCDPAIHSLVMTKAMDCAKMSAKVAGNTPEIEEAPENSLCEL